LRNLASLDFERSFFMKQKRTNEKFLRIEKLSKKSFKEEEVDF